MGPQSRLSATALQLRQAGLCARQGCCDHLHFAQGGRPHPELMPSVPPPSIAQETGAEAEAQRLRNLKEFSKTLVGKRIVYSTLTSPHPRPRTTGLRRAAAAAAAGCLCSVAPAAGRCSPFPCPDESKAHRVDGGVGTGFNVRNNAAHNYCRWTGGTVVKLTRWPGCASLG
jgi:hypothetical protein|eukprot:COSAG01_NODE_3461_length_6067_cov_55.078418_3_plen_171_part_00